MHYIVVEGISLKDIELFVNQKIKDGYQPQGGICIAVDKYEIGFTYIQAMVKEQ